MPKRYLRKRFKVWLGSLLLTLSTAIACFFLTTPTYFNIRKVGRDPTLLLSGGEGLIRHPIKIVRRLELKGRETKGPERRTPESKVKKASAILSVKEEGGKSIHGVRESSKGEGKEGTKKLSGVDRGGLVLLRLKEVMKETERRKSALRYRRRPRWRKGDPGVDSGQTRKSLTKRQRKGGGGPAKVVVSNKAKESGKESRVEAPPQAAAVSSKDTPPVKASIKEKPPVKVSIRETPPVEVSTKEAPAVKAVQSRPATSSQAVSTAVEIRKTDSRRLSLSPTPSWATDIKLPPDDRRRLRLRSRKTKSRDFIMWSAHAEDLVFNALDAIQYPKDCAKTTWLAALSYHDGLFSTLQEYHWALLAGLARGWTVVLRPISSVTFVGCPSEDRSLSCFFNLTSCSFQDNPDKMAELQRSQMRTWNIIGQSENEIGNGTVFQVGRRRKEMSDVLYKSAIFKWKHDIWNTIRDNGWIWTNQGRKVAPLDDSLGVGTSQLYDEFFKSLLSRWIFRPHERILNMADKMMAPYDKNIKDEHGVRRPVVGVHIRQTDKKEDLYFKTYGTYRNVQFYQAAVDVIARRKGYSCPVVWLMSDAASVVRNFSTNLGPLSSHCGGKGSTVCYDPDSMPQTDALEKLGGHKHIPAERKREFQDRFLASVYVLAFLSDQVVVTRTSSVGRLVIQFMESRTRISQMSQLGTLGIGLKDTNSQSTDNL